MKKFLLILLIALVVSAKVQLDTEDLKGFLDWLQKIAEFISSLTGQLKELYQWLKSSQNWDKILELVKEYGKPAAVELCTSLTGLEDVCSNFIDLLLSFIS